MQKLLLSVAVLLIAGCVHSPGEAPLYDRLGGEAGVERIVGALVVHIAGDPRLRPHFRNIHIGGFRDRLEVFLCETAGGPCRWDGRSMRDSHRHLGIDSGAFNALVESLIAAMDDQDIPLGAQNALLARLAPLEADIVSVR